jgi:hypothetical protein
MQVPVQGIGHVSSCVRLYADVRPAGVARSSTSAKRVSENDACYRRVQINENSDNTAAFSDFGIPKEDDYYTSMGHTSLADQQHQQQHQQQQQQQQQQNHP